MGLFDKFRKGLRKTREQGITAQINEVVENYEEITDELYDELEEILIMGDVGFPTAEKIIKSLREKVENDGITNVKKCAKRLKILFPVLYGAAAI